MDSGRYIFHYSDLPRSIFFSLAGQHMASGSTVFEELKSRGLIHDLSDPALFTELSPGSHFYVGIDPTAESLQIGNLIPLMVSIHLARAGYAAIILLGGATGSIGDPSGKSAERKLLDLERVHENTERIKQQVMALFQSAGVEATIVNNLDWTKDLQLLPFLRDVGKHLTVNYMIAKDVVKTRLEGDGISFTEFSYMLLQAHDFYHLYQKYNCRLQVGGSDQWGNITAGLELLRKKGAPDKVYAFSWPLLLDSQGKKFGKSEGQTLWLSSKMTTPYAFHQFWLNISDADVLRYMKIFTFLSADEIEQYSTCLAREPEKRAAQRALADAVTTLIHGAGSLSEAKRGASTLFASPFSEIHDAELEQIFGEVPSSEMKRDDFHLPISELFVQVGLSTSKGEVKRLVDNGGAYVNDQRVAVPTTPASELIDTDRPFALLRSGKKKFHILRIIS